MSELVIGYHPIEEALKTAGPSSLLYIDEKPVKRNSSLEKLAVKGSVRVKRVPASEIEKMVGRGVKHKGAVLVYSPKPAASVKLDLKGYIDQLKDKKDALVLVLDGITDRRTSEPSSGVPICSLSIWSSYPSDAVPSRVLPS